MIEAGLELPGGLDALVAMLTTLEQPLRPSHFSVEEDGLHPADRVDDRARFAAFVAGRKSGFFLLGSSVTYSIRMANNHPLMCDCFLDVAPEDIGDFLIHASTVNPTFAFVAAPEEREHRNRLKIELREGTMEAWVGRNTEKYIPGFYWMTLLSSALATRHNVSVTAVETVARQHIVLGSDQHFFRFYDRPEDWRNTSAVAGLCSSMPGVFDIERVKPDILGRQTFLELTSILMKWS